MICITYYQRIKRNRTSLSRTDGFRSKQCERKYELMMK